MVMQLKKSVGERYIFDRERQLLKRARKKLDQLENLVMLGNGFGADGEDGEDGGHRHLPVLSFMVRVEGFAGFLHHNFVCAILNDLFGIQARGGTYVFTF
jgi:hypothetical protein